MKRITGLFIPIFTLLALAIASVALVPKAHAEEMIAGSSAILTTLEASASAHVDTRIEKLTLFLERYDSPLAPYARTFVEAADVYGLDWRLVAAIAGVESTFGKQIPFNSYNAWGWGIPTGSLSGIGFASWEEGIVEVSRGLKTRYINRGADTIWKIAPIYAPPSTTWAGKVNYFIDAIERFTISKTDDLTLLH